MSSAAASFKRVSMRGTRAPRSSSPISVLCRPARTPSCSCERSATRRQRRRFCPKRSAKSTSHLQNLNEAECRPRWRDQPASAVEQADAGEIADRTLDVVAACEVLRAAGQLAGEIRDDQVRWVERQDVHENDALVLQILRVI